MISIRKPTHHELQEFIWQHQDAPFTYSEIGGTSRDSISGYTCARQRVLLGKGRATFLRAKASLQAWEMFPSEFVDLIWPVPLETGRVVATLFHGPGFWTLNPCRIVYTIDDVKEGQGVSVARYGFAYGTVGNHLASGEERFIVEFNHRDESVWYEVYCFSKACHWLAKAAYPYLRLQQHRFRRLSAKAMQHAARTPSNSEASVGSK